LLEFQHGGNLIQWSEHQLVALQAEAVPANLSANTAQKHIQPKTPVSQDMNEKKESSLEVGHSRLAEASGVGSQQQYVSKKQFKSKRGTDLKRQCLHHHIC